MCFCEIAKLAFEERLNCIIHLKLHVASDLGQCFDFLWYVSRLVIHKKSSVVCFHSCWYENPIAPCGIC